MLYLFVKYLSIVFFFFILNTRKYVLVGGLQVLFENEYFIIELNQLKEHQIIIAVAYLPSR